MAYPVRVIGRKRRRWAREHARATVEDSEWARKNRILELQEPVGFLIQHVDSGRVLTVKDARNEPKVKVIICEMSSLSTGRFHQLWFRDESGIIRSKMNGYALEVTDDKHKLVVSAYDTDQISQQWTFSDSEGFVNPHMSGLRILVKSHCCSRDVIACVTGPDYRSPWQIIRVV